MTILKTLLIDPMREMLTYVVGIIPNLVSAILVFVLGFIIAKVLRDVVHRLLKEMRIDKIAGKAGITTFLHKGGIKDSFSELLSGFVHLLFILMTLVMTAEVVGIKILRVLAVTVVDYVPQVITAVFVFVFGIIVAKIIAKLVYTIAENVHMPNSAILERISRWAIVIYAATISLAELGFRSLLEGTTFHILLGGVVLAYALAYGLGGKDKAAKHLANK